MNDASREKQFADWMCEHVAIVHRVVRAFAVGDNRNDLLQEVMLALWRAVPAFRGESKISTFIYRVAHNAALTWQRGERQHRRRVSGAADIDWMVQPDTARRRSDTPARLEALYVAMGLLSPIDRSLVLLSLDGLSYREIADIHGLSETNVGARLTRARQRLTEIMVAKEDNSR